MNYKSFLTFIITCFLSVSSCAPSMEGKYHINRELKLNNKQNSIPRILLINEFNNTFYNSSVINAYAWNLSSQYENKINSNCDSYKITKHNTLNNNKLST